MPCLYRPATALVLLALLLGCGQKAPLYLPEGDRQEAPE